MDSGAGGDDEKMWVVHNGTIPDLNLQRSRLRSYHKVEPPVAVVRSSGGSRVEGVSVCTCNQPTPPRLFSLARVFIPNPAVLEIQDFHSSRTKIILPEGREDR